MASATQLMTGNDLYAMRSDGMRHELIRGALITMPPAGFEHGSVTVNLATPLDNHVRRDDLGNVVAAETGFIVERNPDTVRAADIAFVSKAKLARIGDYLDGGEILPGFRLPVRDIFVIA